MAPPIAAEALGLPPFTVADLVGELDWPRPRVDVGLVETAGGVRSPQADDGDVCDLVAALGPDLVVLVADAGLGTINSIRLSIDALAGRPGHAGGPGGGRAQPLRRQPRDPPSQPVWLERRDGYPVVVLPGDEAALADLA